MNSIWIPSVPASGSRSRFADLLCLLGLAVGLMAGCKSGPHEDPGAWLDVTFEVTWPADTCPLEDGQHQEARVLADGVDLGPVREGAPVKASLSRRSWEITVLDHRNGPWRTVIDPSVSVRTRSSKTRHYRLKSPGQFAIETVTFQVRREQGEVVVGLMDKWDRPVDVERLSAHSMIFRPSGPEHLPLETQTWSGPRNGYLLPPPPGRQWAPGELVDVRFTGSTDRGIQMIGEVSLTIPP